MRVWKKKCTFKKRLRSASAGWYERIYTELRHTRCNDHAILGHGYLKKAYETIGYFVHIHVYRLS